MARQFSEDSMGPGNKFYLSQAEAQKLDGDLMGEFGYTLEQLMELAGLSCAQAILQCYPPNKLAKGGLVLVCCGPGNNGGDGLVCARHLRLFGYSPSVFYPKHSNHGNSGTGASFFDRLRTQIVKFDIPFLSYFPKDPYLIDNGFDLVIDAIFGFGFKSTPGESPPTIKAPFDEVLSKMNRLKLPIVSIDVPSGWDVDGKIDPVSSLGKYYINPDTLISLTAPKECAKHFRGRFHYLGGRFLPPSLQCKYDLNIPPYQSGKQCVALASPNIQLTPPSRATATSNSQKSNSGNKSKCPSDK